MTGWGSIETAVEAMRRGARSFVQKPWDDTTLVDVLEHLTLLGIADLKGTGNAGNNQITGNAGKNLLRGLDGNDVIDGGLGADTMEGGLGADTYSSSRA